MVIVPDFRHVLARSGPPDCLRIVALRRAGDGMEHAIVNEGRLCHSFARVPVY